MTATDHNVLVAEGGVWVHCDHCLRETRVIEVMRPMPAEGRARGNEGWARFPSGWMNAEYRIPLKLMPPAETAVFVFCSHKCRLAYQKAHKFLHFVRCNEAP